VTHSLDNNISPPSMNCAVNYANTNACNVIGAKIKRDLPESRLKIVFADVTWRK